VIDVEGLLAEISPDAPCGEDLEYGAVDALHRAAQVKPEQQVGSTVVPAEEPDWGYVRRTALKLFSETKDLRVTVMYANAAARTEGWPGFRDGIAVLDGLLERYWAEVHPQLDPDEPDDFTMRMNVVASLADAETTLHYLREAPLVESVMGRYSLKDMLVAEGELSHPADSDHAAPERHAIEAAIMAAELEKLQEVADAVSQTASILEGLESRLMSLVGAASAPDLSSLTALVGRAAKEVSRGLSLRPDAVDAAAEEEQAALEEGGAAAPAAGAAAPSGGRRGPISSRDDVRRAIEEICDYYRKYEPSSPIPILLERAKRLIQKDFMEILQDIAPDGLPAVETLRGVQDEYSQ
jgi:type VI secretion system protein ImpA